LAVHPHGEDANPDVLTYWDKEQHVPIIEKNYGILPPNPHPMTYSFARYLFLYRGWLYILHTRYYEPQDQLGKMMMLQGDIWRVDDEQKFAESEGEGVNHVAKIDSVDNPKEFAERVKQIILSDGWDDDDDEEDVPEPDPAPEDYVPEPSNVPAGTV